MRTNVIQAVNYDYTDAQLAEAADATLRAFVALTPDGQEFEGVQMSLLRDLWTTSLTAAAATEVLAAFLVDLYAEQMSKHTFDQIFRAGYRLRFDGDWRNILPAIALFGFSYSDSANRYTFYDEQYACQQLLGNTHLASGLADQLVVIAFFVSHMEQYMWSIENGEDSWGAHIYPLLQWFQQASAAVVALRKVA